MDGDLSRDSGHYFSDFLRLALERVRTDGRARITGPTRQLGCGLERSLRSGNDARLAASERRIAGLRSLGLVVVKERLHGARSDNAVAPEHGLGVGQRSSPSGVVGPDAITDGSSPGTSEIIKDTTLAGAAARARRPPLIAERCFRTQLILLMLCCS